MKLLLPIIVFVAIASVVTFLADEPSISAVMANAPESCEVCTSDLVTPFSPTECMGDSPFISQVSSDAPCNGACAHIFFVNLGSGHECSWEIEIVYYEEQDFLACTMQTPLAEIEGTLTKLIKPTKQQYQFPQIDTHCGKQRYVEIYVDGDLVWLGNIGCDDAQCQ